MDLAVAYWELNTSWLTRTVPSSGGIFQFSMFEARWKANT